LSRLFYSYHQVRLLLLLLLLLVVEAQSSQAEAQAQTSPFLGFSAAASLRSSFPQRSPIGGTIAS
jgi:hypothetical protein